ncbi:MULTISPECIES: hypothetical protein [Streptomyces]|uniref:Uncharacterized protein n=1 Tax=Streptomyces venezuelae (strain ATCC 10712 / CBS 650.69 / DSM 40230 / JCM 4526 / NBRC 13096 / PD 04745) TaxID=953739 RepID=F2RL04_STRVP|nr:hypothetical protein [Streptomyces venezuelae]APE21373.1 hypothetical protein vnz_10300 [Streptomyces venezuelae]QER98763.1 hypothetical protein DEJ43_10435 [Streptomyces venezuelae ATCC 10712]CCA55393.1 hypothetical protein SVEN_2107 [Streptomyces venezuelae ATCC 10712]
MNDLDTCLRCRRELRDHEAGRYLCNHCEDRVAVHLGAIPGLFVQLDQHLARGSSSGPTVSGSKTAPAPLRIGILDMQTERGPILAPLETWVRDWEEAGYAEVNEAGTATDRVTHACRTLRFNLSRAAAQHPAIDEAADEIASIWRMLSRTVTGETAPRRIAVTCPCEQTLRITLDTRGETCPRCGAEYGHSEVLRLPLADRRAAA